MPSCKHDLAVEWRFLSVYALLFLVSVTGAIYSTETMPRMPMPGAGSMSAAWMRMPGQSWVAAAGSFMGMWVVMMVPMMLPSLLPPLLCYRRSAPTSGESNLDLLTTTVVVGYFFVWAICGAAVYPLGVRLSDAEMRWPVFMRSVPVATGMVLMLAGGVQFTPRKARQLALCRDAYLPGTLPSAYKTAWHHGLQLGLDCTLCCVGLVAVLLVGGMSLLSMAMVTAAITLERIARKPERVARIIGLVLIALGITVMARMR